MTRFLIDENIFPEIAHFLLAKGFDVVDVHNANLQGCDDDAIFSYAVRERRIIITFDKHFADVLRYPPSQHWGIIRIRIEPPLLEDIYSALDHFFNNFDINEFHKSLIVLDRNGYRIRRNP